MFLQVVCLIATFDASDKNRINFVLTEGFQHNVTTFSAAQRLHFKERKLYLALEEASRQLDWRGAHAAASSSLHQLSPLHQISVLFRLHHHLLCSHFISHSVLFIASPLPLLSSQLPSVCLTKTQKGVRGVSAAPHCKNILDILYFCKNNTENSAHLVPVINFPLHFNQTFL